MNHKSSKTPIAAALVCAAALSAGCANNNEIEQLKSMVREAQDSAAAAQRTANEAKATADQALQAAQGAQQCCKDTNEKIDRMFKRSMYK